MSRGNNWWEGLKIGGGAAPIETSIGVDFLPWCSQTCNGYVYSIEVIFDIDNPSIVSIAVRIFF